MLRTNNSSEAFTTQYKAWLQTFILVLGNWYLFLMEGRRKWHPTPVLLPVESHGWRSLVGYSTWAHKESGMTEWLHFFSRLIGHGYLWKQNFVIVLNHWPTGKNVIHEANKNQGQDLTASFGHAIANITLYPLIYHHNIGIKLVSKYWNWELW